MSLVRGLWQAVASLHAHVDRIGGDEPWWEVLILSAVVLTIAFLLWLAHVFGYGT